MNPFIKNLIFRQIATASTNAAVISATDGDILQIIASNLTAAAKFLKIYNKATTPVPSTDTPAMTIALPANSTISLSGPIQFMTGISIAITGALADTDTTATAAGDTVVNIVYVQ
jgi:hypothetical protein